MADVKLSQTEIDALLASLSASSGHAPAVRDSHEHQIVDFRRPNKFAREHMRSLESAHEVFTRRLTSLFTQALRAVVSLEPVSTDQITYEDYTRSIPNPSVLTRFAVDPLPGPVVVEMSTQMALTLLDRLLGGIGTPIGSRRPTEIESSLIRALMTNVGGALEDALKPLEEITAAIEVIEFNPQFLQAVAPTEMVLMLTYRISLHTTYRPEGLLSLCYPFSTLAPAMGRLEQHAWYSQAAGERTHDEAQPLRDHLPDIALPVAVRLQPAPVPARDLVALKPGDVIRLTHRVDQPAVAVIGESEVMRARIGRRGRRLAMQIADWSE